MSKQLKSLFSQLCLWVNLPNYNEIKPTRGIKCLKLDFDSIYGGYRIDIVHEDTSESFFHFSSRFSQKEMAAHIQGLIHGMAIKQGGVVNISAIY